MDNIFNLIKLKNFLEIRKIISDNENIDLNIFDNQNNYFIHYILLYDQIDILEIILKRNIRLDILDTDGRTILHIPIKFNYFISLEMLLNFNKKLIGISIIDIKDKLGLTALHYCVILNNYECFKLLIKFDADPYIRNSIGNNVFHLALKYNNKEILSNLLDNNNLNFLSLNNESLLQLAISNNNIDTINILLNKKINLNNQEKEYGICALHLSIINNMVIVCDKLIKNGANINLQDSYGYTSLMYAVNEKYFDIDRKSVV